MRAYFNIEHEDARLYHIVLNTERLSIETCVKTVSELTESPRFKDTAAIRSTLANRLVEAEICSALADQISFPAVPLGVSVSVTDGKVTLAGTTSSGSASGPRRSHTISPPRADLDDKSQPGGACLHVWP
jgi:hypothetical protein